MKKFNNEFKKLIHEGQLAQFLEPEYSDKYQDTDWIEKNPTIFELLRICKKDDYHEVRMWITDTDTYAWESSRARHEDVAESEVFEPKNTDIPVILKFDEDAGKIRRIQVTTSYYDRSVDNATLFKKVSRVLGKYLVDDFDYSSPVFFISPNSKWGGLPRGGYNVNGVVKEEVGGAGAVPAAVEGGAISSSDALGKLPSDIKNLNSGEWSLSARNTPGVTKKKKKKKSKIQKRF